MKRAPAMAPALGFAAATFVLFLPMSLAPGQRLLGWGPDEKLFLWALAWDVHALVSQPLRLFDANIFFPNRETLAYSESFLGSALLGSPILLASGSLVLTANAVILASYFLSALGAFVLVRRLGMSRCAASLAGIVFAFAPPHFYRYAQPHLAAVQWIPFCLAFIHAYASTGRRRHVLLAGVFFAFQVLTSAHGGLLLAFAAGGLALYLATTRPKPCARLSLRDVGLAASLVLVTGAWMARPYYEARRSVGLQRDLGGLADASADAASLIASPTRAHQALISLVPALEERTATARAYLFPGGVTLALALLALAAWRRLPPGSGYYAVLAGFALWMSLGPSAGLYRWLYHVVPGLDFVRVPSRFGLVWLLAVAVLAAAGFERVASRWASPRSRLALAAAAWGLLLVEFAAIPLDTTVRSLAVPAADRWLAGREGPIVELPVSDPDDWYRASDRHSEAMLHSTAHWLPLVNGYSGWEPPAHTALFRTLAGFPDEPSLGALEAVGVRYAVVHPGEYRRGEWRRAESRFAIFGDRLQLEFQEGGDLVYRLRRSAAPSAFPAGRQR